METVWFIGLIALWGVVLVNLLLTLRVIHWLRAVANIQEQAAEVENLPDLPIGMPAPNFQTETISGEPVGLNDYVGRALVLVFVSPYCKDCQREMPMLVELGAVVKERTGIELVLVSDSGTAKHARSWLNTIREEDELKVDLPILIASRSTTEFMRSYNPRGLAPYFCYIDDQGVVQDRAPLSSAKWRKLKREWEDEAVRDEAEQIAEVHRSRRGDYDE
jgi:peroxiredoxin